MTRKRRRLAVVLVCGLGLGSAAALSLSAFSSSISFFVTPSQLAGQMPGGERSFRLGGLVQQGSLQKTMDGSHPAARFRVTDGKDAITVNYVGILPDLFREGQGIVALGTLAPDGTFRAQEVLAKHDATYMPKDIADALKKSGRWNPAAGPPPPADTWNDLTVKAGAVNVKKAGG